MYPPIQAPKRLLFGPGPSMVAPRVYEAMGQPVVGHLDPFFFQTSEEIRKLLGYAYSTKNEFNMAISGTGTAGIKPCSRRRRTCCGVRRLMRATPRAGFGIERFFRGPRRIPFLVRREDG